MTPVLMGHSPYYLGKRVLDVDGRDFPERLVEEWHCVLPRNPAGSFKKGP